MTDRIGTLVIDLQGKRVSREDKEILMHPLIGGVILFAHNYESRQQMLQMCQQIREVRKDPLLIMVDQEGGRVQRFIHEFTQIPFMGKFGRLFDENPMIACQMLQDCGWLMAMELLSIGVDISLAPVLDLNKGVSSIIGDRAFHSRPENVITMATAFIEGMKEAGMSSTGKHFPGHGSVALDSHIDNPVDERTVEELEEDDLMPFAGMVKSGIAAIMASHIIFPKADSLPVSYSRYWLNDVLRKQLGFEGVIISDDLSMEGANISESYSDRVRTAREAGCDFVLLCNNRKAVMDVLDDLHEYRFFQTTMEKLNGLKADFASFNHAYKETTRWKKTHGVLNKLNAE